MGENCLWLKLLLVLLFVMRLSFDLKFLLCKVSAWVEKQKRVPSACVQGCEQPIYAFAMKSRTTCCAKEEV